MKIEKYGTVVISEDEILVTEFTFNGEGSPITKEMVAERAIAWVRQRIDEEEAEMNVVGNDFKQG